MTLCATGSPHTRDRDSTRIFRIIRMRIRKILKISFHASVVSSGKLFFFWSHTHWALKAFQLLFEQLCINSKAKEIGKWSVFGFPYKTPYTYKHVKLRKAVLGSCPFGT